MPFGKGGARKQYEAEEPRKAGMLILTRKPGESIYIGDHIRVTINEIKGNQVRVGIDAPSDLRIYREEIYLQILEENKQAAAAAFDESAGLESLSKAFGGPSSGGTDGEGKPRRLGPSSAAPSGKFTPAPTRPGGEPQVFVKRKKAKQDE